MTSLGDRREMKSFKPSEAEQRLLSEITNQDATDTLLLLGTGRPPPMPLNQIAEHLGHSEPRTDANLRRLKQYGLIKSLHKSPERTESQVYVATARGRRITREVLTAKRRHALT